MDRIRNPFTPGAGYLPPELAGRNQVIEDGQVVALRTKLHRAERGLMLIGPRGVGKTVLLKCLSEHARENGIIPVISEIRNDKSDLEDLAQKLKEALYTLDFKCKVKSYIQEAFSVLGNFVRKFSLNIGDVGVSVELHRGLGESGNMELDLSQVLLSAARAAKAASTAIGLYIDELQNLDEEAMRGIIVALHRSAQELLPLYMIGSGLPTIRTLVGKSKTYAERMFVYETIGALDEDASWAALVKPFEDNGVSVEDAAFSEMFKASAGYPFFLQEFGYQVWQHAKRSPIAVDDVVAILPQVMESLDRSFFEVRFDRVSAVEKRFLMAMAQGEPEKPQSIVDIAERMGRSANSLSMMRRSLIKKGMIFSPSIGMVAYTVPMFGTYMMRMSKDCGL
jgi:hypothetical protein